MMVPLAKVQTAVVGKCKDIESSSVLEACSNINRAFMAGLNPRIMDELTGAKNEVFSGLFSFLDKIVDIKHLSAEEIVQLTYE